MEEVLLTDDEVVALAVDRSTFWPGGVPTVSAGDPSSLAEASFRGHRSLVVRRLIDDDGVFDPSISGFGSELPGSNTHLTVYLADDGFRRAGWGIGSTHYPSTGEWVLETLNPLGIHRLIRMPAEDHRSYFVAMLAGADRAGPERQNGDGNSQQPTWLCILSINATGAILAAARRGEVRVGPVTIVDDRITPISSLAAVDPEGAVAVLLGSGGSGESPARGDAG